MLFFVACYSLRVMRRLLTMPILRAFRPKVDADQNQVEDIDDFILIDTPPGKAMLSFNGLVAADLILVPAAAERMAIDGVFDLINHVQNIMWDKYKLDRQEIRILFTMYKVTTSHSPGILRNARKIWRDNVLSMKIPETIEFPRSFDKRQPLNIYQPRHPGALAYASLADWLIAYDEKAKT